MAFEIENGVLKSVYDVEDEEFIYVPNTVKTIATRAFNRLTITEIFIPNSVKSIQRKAFLNCNIQKISIPEYIDTTGIFSHCNYPEIEKRKKGIFSHFNYPKIERRKPTTKTTTVEEAFAEKTVVEEVHDIPAKPSETDYKQLFLDAVYAKNNTDMEKIFDKIFEDDVKIPVAVYLFTAYEIEKAEKYISDNFQKVMHYLVDKQDINGINVIMSIKNREQTI